MFVVEGVIARWFNNEAKHWVVQQPCPSKEEAISQAVLFSSGPRLLIRKVPYLAHCLKDTPRHPISKHNTGQADQCCLMQV